MFHARVEKSASNAEQARGESAIAFGLLEGNPFASGAGSSCTVWKEATLGPCHSNTFHRQEATEGQIGLPTRLELLIVDGSCNPVPDAIV